jgi:hypothetical protein
MSLTDAATIDLVTRLPGEPARAALLIYDNGEIADDLERENALRRKLSAYLLFVESGQFTEAYPGLSDAELSVEVVCSVAPTDGMKLIEGVRPPHRSDFFLPVNIAGEAEFRAKLGLSKAKTR